MGNGNAKASKNSKLADEIDRIASNYILQQNFNDINKLSDKGECDKLVILTAKVIGKNLNALEQKEMVERISKGSEETEEKKGVVGTEPLKKDGVVGAEPLKKDGPLKKKAEPLDKDGEEPLEEDGAEPVEEEDKPKKKKAKPSEESLEEEEEEDEDEKPKKKKQKGGEDEIKETDQAPSKARRTTSRGRRGRARSKARGTTRRGRRGRAPSRAPSRASRCIARRGRRGRAPKRGRRGRAPRGYPPMFNHSQVLCENRPCFCGHHENHQSSYYRRG